MTAALLAGCADSRSILGDPLGNPFKSASTDPTPTGSFDSSMGAPPPYRASSGVVSRPLAPPSTMRGPQVATYGTSTYDAPRYDAPVRQSPHLSSTYNAPPTDRTSSIASGKGGWSVSGGMPVIAANGETAIVIGERYNVPADVLLRTNGLKSSAQIHAGTRLVIPVYSASSHAIPAKVVVLRKPNDRVVKERVIVKRDGKGAVIVRHEAPKNDTMHWVKGPPPAKKTAVIVDKPSKAVKEVVVQEKREKAAPQVSARVVDPTPTASLQSASESVATSSSGSPEFRWPAHGRIIQGFKTGGNDGINIAVPEGTSVKAAESGVVAYAGGEVKGFGNLVLIRHPNGYVTAYANNGSLNVHRGDQVKRGQTIAKSGQSGNVASPQLHFELRKGSTPVDPTRYLAGL